ncbi:TRPM8 channel-associated factor homolog [Centropristis striata]|uniref:TRPM8 channel-associated factor homolog n=1 Tax=Centropristis striata TaxID=184440 RepID=UPI0027E1CE62|nr:TRPM8 channel-associated factor homolog [Centropristis striata]
MCKTFNLKYSFCSHRSTRCTHKHNLQLTQYTFSCHPAIQPPHPIFRASTFLTMSDQPTQSYHEGAYKSLMRGLTELNILVDSVPCELVLSGDHAFPLAMNSQGQVLMAASLYGSGRIVVLSHESYLTLFPALVENAVTWLRGDGSDNLSVGVHNSAKWVAKNLSKSGFNVQVVGKFSDSAGVGVYVTDAYSVAPDANDLVAFMKAGGGVLIGGQAWHWATSHPPETTILQFPGNKVSGVSGINFTPYYGTAEILPVPPHIPSSWMALRVGKNFEDDWKSLLQGVSEFDLGRDLVASEVLVHGPLAFPIGTTEDGRAFLAGTYYGKGRVIVIAHEAPMSSKALSSFWNNAIGWLDQGRKGVVGVVPGRGYLSQSGLQYEETEFRKDLSVFVCDVYSDQHMEEIQDFVAEGGGLLIGGHAWYWAQTHPGRNPMTDFLGNKILNKMGLSLLAATIKEDTYKATKETYHFRQFLHSFVGHLTKGTTLTEQDEEKLEKLESGCINFLNMKAYDSYSYTQVLTILTDMLKSHMPQVSENNPVKTPTDHLLLSLGIEVYNVSPDRDALLPYLIHDAKMPFVYNRRLRINADTAGSAEWISTGLYLSPGLKTEMIMPAELVNKNWMVQIGCQSDYLKHEELKRAPRVHQTFLVDTEKMEVWNLWGGLIYLVAPPNMKVEGAEVRVQIATPAPYYKCGVTTADEWPSLRTAPAPWAEFEFDNIVLTVPSEVIRGLERPDEVAGLWNDIMKGVADLAVIPRKFERKERIVADVQISAGWMHAGYPVMMHSSKASELFRLNDARTKGLWGESHELGHNQQRSNWEFRPHTTEATCNLWSVYVHEEVLGLNRAKAHEALTLKERKERVEKYIREGRNLSNWKLWVALETYLQLQERFGWGAFKEVFAAYHEMSGVPTDNDGKMNLYAETFSRAVEMNLCGFFKAWGWPITRATEEILCSLPPWRDHPMV